MKELPEIIARVEELPPHLQRSLIRKVDLVEQVIKNQLIACFAYQLKEHARFQRELEVILMDELNTEGDFA